MPKLTPRKKQLLELKKTKPDLKTNNFNSNRKLFNNKKEEMFIYFNF